MNLEHPTWSAHFHLPRTVSRVKREERQHGEFSTILVVTRIMQTNTDHPSSNKSTTYTYFAVSVDYFLP
jgi:hypothetical protein